MPAAWAQEKKEECASKEAKLSEFCVSAADLLGKLDLAVPENSLFALMGATPETVIRPKVGDKFATSLLPQIVDALGNDQYALAIEANPGLYMMPKGFSSSDLTGETSGLSNARLWSQFTVSAATSRAVGENTITQYGVGINFSHDTGSPLNVKAGYGDCIDNQFAGIRLVELANVADDEVRDDPANKDWFERDAFQTLKPEFAEKFDAAVTERTQILAKKKFSENTRGARKMPTVDEAVSACARQYTRWNRNMYGGGVAFYNSQTDPVNSTVVPPLPSTSESGYGAWATASFALGSINPIDKSRSGIDPDGQFTISARYTDNLVRERKNGNAKITETVDGWRIGARFTHSFSSNEDEEEGSKSDAFRGFIEAAYSEEKFGTIKDHFTQAGIGLEVQVAKDVYLQAVIGDTMGSKIDRSTYFTGQLKWSFSNGLAK
jgi:hypothetical protein